VIVGFGGLFAARALRRDDVDVTVIDRNNHHLFQPLLYQMATGILAEGDIAPPQEESRCILYADCGNQVRLHPPR
jgi:NADH dehydrogenase